MNAGFFDVLHDAAHQRARSRTALLNLLGTACFVRFKVSDDVDVNFNGVGQKAINQDWCVCQVADIDGSGHVAAQRGLVEANFHAASTENVTGANQHWVTNAGCFSNCFVKTARNSRWWLIETKFFKDGLETIAIFCQVNALNAGADNRYTSGH